MAYIRPRLILLSRDVIPKPSSCNCHGIPEGVVYLLGHDNTSQYVAIAISIEKSIFTSFYGMS
jgi:hypothetical protein